MIAIMVRDIHREYSIPDPSRRGRTIARKALRGVSLTINQNEIFGLLGPNGAGKTTLVKILSTILLPTGGSASVCGFDVVTSTQEVRKRISLVLGGERGHYYRLTAVETMHFWGALYHLSPIEIKKKTFELLELVGLADRADDRVETYSRGMKQRLHIARGLLADPSVIFLDEPTAGLDPAAAALACEVVLDLQRYGKTVFVTTHNMKEAETLCDRVGFINKGTIDIIDQPRNLVQMADGLEVVEVAFASHSFVSYERLRGLPGVVSVSKEQDIADDHVRFVLHVRGSDSFPLLVGQLAEMNVRQISTRTPSLDDVYLQIMSGAKHRMPS